MIETKPPKWRKRMTMYTLKQAIFIAPEIDEASITELSDYIAAEQFTDTREVYQVELDGDCEKATITNIITGNTVELVIDELSLI